LAGAIECGLAPQGKTAQFLVNAVDRSALTGWFMDVNNISEKATGGRLGLAALTGRPVSRYASRNMLRAVAGPTADLAEDMRRVVSGTVNGEWTEMETRALRRVLPYQNLFYARKVFDDAEAGINAYFGVPMKQH
jgi:hypothetical protein